MRYAPNTDDDLDDDPEAYVDVRKLHLDSIIGARCGCATCKWTRDRDHGRKRLPRPLQAQRRRRRSRAVPRNAGERASG
jgi:hypothetical protein